MNVSKQRIYSYWGGNTLLVLITIDQCRALCDKTTDRGNRSEGDLRAEQLIQLQNSSNKE